MFGTKKKTSAPSAPDSNAESVATRGFLNVLSVEYGLGDGSQEDQTAVEEGRVITLELDNFFVVNVYTPNSGQGLTRLDYRVKQWDMHFAGIC